jgi:hypothetical protein
MNMLPNGALLEEVVFYYRDTNPGFGLDVLAQLCVSDLDSATGALVFLGCENVLSSGAPGDAGMKLDSPQTIRYRYEEAGVFKIRQYTLAAGTPAADSSTAIRAVRLLWRREVSPAPAQATFGDVPTNDSAFQFIEALVASGITAGCGGGNFCPDAPLTRRQMAVFLAKALGLHWPWDAP